MFFMGEGRLTSHICLMSPFLWYGPGSFKADQKWCLQMHNCASTHWNKNINNLIKLCKSFPQMAGVLFPIHKWTDEQINYSTTQIPFLGTVTCFLPMNAEGQLENTVLRDFSRTVTYVEFKLDALCQHRIILLFWQPLYCNHLCRKCPIIQEMLVVMLFILIR